MSEHPLPECAWCSDFSTLLLWVLLSHRKLSVFLAVLVCLVISSLSVFFLFPRSITVQPAGLNSSSVAFDKADIHLNITVGGCLYPCAQQYSSIALIQCCDPGTQRVSETLGGSRSSHEPHNQLCSVGTFHSEGSKPWPKK